MGKPELPAYKDVKAPDLAQESGSGVDPDFGESSSSAADPSLGHSPPTYHDITTTNPTPEFKHIDGHGLCNPRPILSNDLATDAAALESFLLEETAIAPHPFLTVRGTHTERVSNSSKGSKTRIVTDFSLTFSLYQFMSSSPGTLSIVSPDAKAFRGTRTRCTQAHGGTLPNTQLDIGYQIRAFTGSDNYLKTFTLTKHLSIDETYVREELTRIIRATDYNGSIYIKFPWEGGTKVVARDHWVNRLRYGCWRWAFYVSMLWVLIWPVLWVLTLRWKTAELVWKQRNGEGTERLWVAEYGQAVGALARSKSKGAVTEAELRGVNEALGRPVEAVQGAGPRRL